MTLSLIVAMSRNRVIGRNNALPWRLPADLAHFRKLTMGHWLLMGRKTFESIGRPLPGRTIVVISRRPDFRPPGVLVAHSLQEAISMAEGDEVFIAGGGEIFREALPLAGRLYLTLIESEFEGDVFFPEFEPGAWRLVSEESHAPDEKNAWACRFRLYEK